MDKVKRVVPNKVITVEFKVSMYCNGCERTVAKVISKCEGVQKFVTDMNKHRVVVTGCIDPNKVMKKLKKKTGKIVEIVSNKDEESNDDDDDCHELMPQTQFVHENDYFMNTETLMIFSDENPNACSIM